MQTIQQIQESYQVSNELMSSVQDLLRAAKPILGIKHIGYRRFLTNGKGFGFSTDTKWNQTFLEHFHDVRVSEYEELIAKYLQTEQKFSLRVGLPDQNSEYEQRLYSDGLWNSFLLYRKTPQEKCIEIFFLCGTKENINMIDSCINKLGYVTNLVDEIQKKINTILSTKPLHVFSETLTNPSLLAKM